MAKNGGLTKLGIPDSAKGLIAGQLEGVSACNFSDTVELVAWLEKDKFGLNVRSCTIFHVTGRLCQRNTRQVEHRGVCKFG